MLVHMAPEEVSGLQALARAGGGTLTLNPDTGLPEANFLKRLLPMLIGAGITAATGGAAAPWMIGLGLGGAETIRTGSLEKGLMAGLGAYGGAGLAGGLAAAGAASPTAAAQALGTPAATGAGSQAAMLASQNAGFGQAGIDALASSAGTAAGAAPVATNVFSAGANALGTEAGRSAALSGMGGGAQAAKYGLAALSPTLQPDAAKPYDGGGPNPYEYEYDPNNQRYTRVAPGTRARDMMPPSLAPITTMAAGGPIEDMSYQNRMDTMMANNGQMFAGGGQINLQGTIDMGGGGGGQFGQASNNGYKAAGSGSAGQFGNDQMMAPAVMPSPNPFSSGMGGGRMGELDVRRLQEDGYDPRAVQANPQGFRQYHAARLAADHAANMPRPQGGSYGQYLAGRNPMQQDVQMSREQFDSSQQRANALEQMSAAHVMPQQYNSSSTTDLLNSIGAGGSFAAGGIASMARGGQSHLGDYSDGGRLLKGPGDGVSDSIPATIADKRPARLADGEFVVPARIVSELGNGSTEAGARKLYAMMDRVQKARGKTTGKDRVAVNSSAEKLLPA
jgi:hypothetical protein